LEHLGKKRRGVRNRGGDRNAGHLEAKKKRSAIKRRFQLPRGRELREAELKKKIPDLQGAAVQKT